MSEIQITVPNWFAIGFITSLILITLIIAFLDFYRDKIARTLKIKIERLEVTNYELETEIQKLRKLIYEVHFKIDDGVGMIELTDEQKELIMDILLNKEK